MSTPTVGAACAAASPVLGAMLPRSDMRPPSPRPVHAPRARADSSLSFCSRSSCDSEHLDPRRHESHRSWIEKAFQKRECVHFVPTAKDGNRCGCGQTLVQHVHRRSPSPHPHGPPPTEDIWVSSKHTALFPTDSFGVIEFQGGPHAVKAQYVRLAFDTPVEMILRLLTHEWQLELPKLLISVHGGKANFDLQPKLKAVLRQGLVRAAKTTGAWLFTAGTNTGVMKHVGDALVTERSRRLTNRVISIGIAPWGIIENRQELIGKDSVVQYHSIPLPKSRFAVLNNHHSFFILVDNGTVGKYGAEIALRKKLERYISQQKIFPSQPLLRYSLPTSSHSTPARLPQTETRSNGVPVVCIVVEGGTNTIRSALEYVTDSPPVPVVICDGSGRAADLLAFAHKYLRDDGKLPDMLHNQLLATVQKTFECPKDVAKQLMHELLECVCRKDLITVFRMGEEPCQELDQAILAALLKGSRLCAPEQLSLSLTWNRVDIAETEIFVYGQEWPFGSLEEAMMDALLYDRVDFVKLLLKNGVSMRKFLTIQRLEELYNTLGSTNTLRYLVRDVKKNVPPGYRYTLYDIGLVIERLMGGAFRSSYCRRRFRNMYNHIMGSKSTGFLHRQSIADPRHATSLDVEMESSMFKFPFNELLVWAVLMQRQQMALFMWQHGEEALAKLSALVIFGVQYAPRRSSKNRNVGIDWFREYPLNVCIEFIINKLCSIYYLHMHEALVACRLNKAMANEASQDDLEADVSEELRKNAREFEDLSLELLDYCYREDDDLAQQLLTYELQNWSKQTCLTLAVSANHRAFVAHTCCQILLADLWMGGLRMRRNTNIKVILGLVCPPFILTLEFKSNEELQHQPQTEEEYMQALQEMYNHQISSSSTVDTEEQHSEEEFPMANEDQRHVSSTAKLENGKVTQIQVEQETSSFLPPRKIPLRLGRKVYEFYAAPVTKFWGHTIAFTAFLCCFTYVVLVRMYIKPEFIEFYVICYLLTVGIEKIRELVISEPVTFAQKFTVWSEKKWNPCDVVLIVFFLVGLCLRLNPETLAVGRVIYIVDIMYWYIRILDILSVNKYLGPFVTMIGKMVVTMIYFVVLLAVVLVAFGVCRQAILFPNKEPSWKLARDIFFMPYWMIYGEVFADQIDPSCGGKNETACITGQWITPAAMAIYLLIANILLVNLLIAIFNHIFQEVNAISQEIWKFQRFLVVMEYEQKPILPPPLIFFSHLYLLAKDCFRRYQKKKRTYDISLKLFLYGDNLQRIHDFEEECVDGFFREKATRLHMSTDERVRHTNDRVEIMSQKVEDVYHRESLATMSLQTVDLRLTRLEESADHTTEVLSHIQQLMDLHGSPGPGFGEVQEILADDQLEEAQPTAYSSSEEEILPEDDDNFRAEASEPETSTAPLSLHERRRGHRRLQRSTRQTSVDHEPNDMPLRPPPKIFLRSLSMSHHEQKDDPQPTPRYQRRGSSVGADTPIKVVPATPRPLLANTRNVYTSITDELESNLLSPARSLMRLGSSASDTEQVLQEEAQMLHNAELADYQLMEGLIQRRLHRNSENLTNSLEDLCVACYDSDQNEDDHPPTAPPISYHARDAFFSSIPPTDDDQTTSDQSRPSHRPILRRTSLMRQGSVHAETRC